LLAHIISQQSGKRNDGKVFGLERIPEICELGGKNLAKYFDESRAKITCADGTQGLLEEAPFDKILVGAAASKDIPQAWRDQLKIGGKIVAPISRSVWLFVKKSETEWEEKEFPGFAFVPLVRNSRLTTNNLRSTTPEKLGPPKRITKKTATLMLLVVGC
jgi:protein-L-isoaspartate(D-aspartate) O-methyltransferase